MELTHSDGKTYFVEDHLLPGLKGDDVSRLGQVQIDSIVDRARKLNCRSNDLKVEAELKEQKGLVDLLTRKLDAAEDELCTLEERGQESLKKYKAEIKNLRTINRALCELVQRLEKGR